MPCSVIYRKHKDWKNMLDDAMGMRSAKSRPGQFYQVSDLAFSKVDCNGNVVKREGGETHRLKRSKKNITMQCMDRI